MRISYWSSDVCSSDLDQLSGRRPGRNACPAARGWRGDHRWSRVARERQVRVDHGSRGEQGRTLGTQSLESQGQSVGWVERSETHRSPDREWPMGFAALYPSYGWCFFVL